MTMNPVSTQSWHYKGLTLRGNSLAGVGTSLACPELNCCFDVAQGLPHAFGIQNFLISHCHMDHAAGIPYLISQKALTGQKTPDFYVPKTMVEPLDHIMKTWQNMEGHQYQYNFIGVDFETEYPLKGAYFFKAFPSVHRVDSVGYTVFRRSKKLKDIYAELAREELIELKRRGQEIEHHFSQPILTFTGDTKIEFLNQRDWIKDSQVLVMEVTYIDEKKSVENARKWGHIHFDELLVKLPLIQSEKILLIHLSARYSVKEFVARIRQVCRPEDVERLVVFPRDGNYDTARQKTSST